MNNNEFFPIGKIHTIIFDFDGVMTNNKVYCSASGNEFVQCDRSDGYAFDLLRKFIKIKKLHIDYFILSTEKNSVVKHRAEKLKVECFQGQSSKIDFLKNYLKINFSNHMNPEKGIIYLGNDLNDYRIMKFVGYTFAPVDAHPIIKKNSKFVIEKKGGEGFVRKFVEILIESSGFDIIDFI